MVVGAHLTSEAFHAIEVADIVLHVGNDSLAREWLLGINPNVESLEYLYKPGIDRRLAYDGMVDVVEMYLNQRLGVCFAMYGHPSVFAYPGRAAIRRARQMGVPARMLPGLSASDALFVDLQIDPGERGWQSYEATDFLIRRRSWDVNTPLVLWQISSVGRTGAIDAVAAEGLEVLTSYLCERYGPNHIVTLYLAAQFPGVNPIMNEVPLASLSQVEVHPMMTLYVPPSGDPPIDPDMMRRLDLRSRADGQ